MQNIQTIKYQRKKYFSLRKRYKNFQFSRHRDITNFQKNLPNLLKVSNRVKLRYIVIFLFLPSFVFFFSFFLFSLSLSLSFPLFATPPTLFRLTTLRIPDKRGTKSFAPLIRVEGGWYPTLLSQFSMDIPSASIIFYF